MTAASLQPGGRIRVASYNVHACVGRDGRYAPERTAAVIRDLDADVVALQEVEDRDCEGLSVSEFLADRSGLAIAGRSTHPRAGLDYGNLLLSRFSTRASQTHDLAVAAREPRAAIESDFLVDGCRLRVFATHFGLSLRERHIQFERLRPRLADGETDLQILCADFNEWLPFSGVRRGLRRLLGRTPALATFPSGFPLLALDRIYAAPAGLLTSIDVASTPAARIASDHRPVVAEFELPSLAD